MSLFIRAVSERYLPLQNEQAMRNMFQLLLGDIVIIKVLEVHVKSDFVPVHEEKNDCVPQSDHEIWQK